MTIRLFIVILMLLISLAQNASAYLLPGPSASRISQDVIKGASVICTGVATTSFEGERCSQNIYYRAIDGSWKILAFEVDGIIKGELDGRIIMVNLFVANEEELLPLSSIPLHKRCVLFLKKDRDGSNVYVLYDPMRSAFPLSSEPAKFPDGATIDDKLQLEFFKAIETGDVSMAVTAIENLPRLAPNQKQESIRVLESVSSSTNNALACAAIAARIRLGDYRAIADARAAFEAWKSAGQAHNVPRAYDASGSVHDTWKCPFLQYWDILLALSVVKDPEAIPELIKLLQSKNARLRQEASRALRLISDQHDIDLLHVFEKALSDPDEYVQFDAFWGLIHQTLGRVIGPGLSDFLKRREFYMEKLQAWWSQNRESFLEGHKEEARQKAYEMLPWLNKDFDWE